MVLTLDVEIELEQTVLSLPDVVVTGTMYERSPFENSSTDSCT
jgi:hypothetical protein